MLCAPTVENNIHTNKKIQYNYPEQRAILNTEQQMTNISRTIKAYTVLHITFGCIMVIDAKTLNHSP